MTEITTEVLLTLDRCGASNERALEELRTAEAIILEMQALEKTLIGRTKPPLLIMGMSWA
jgi:hypothetical protein